MKKNWKKVLAGTFAAALLLTGCGGGATNNGGGNNSSSTEGGDKAGYKVGIIQLAEHVALDRAREGFEEELKNSGLDIDIDLVNAQGDLSLTSTAPKKFVESGVDLVYAIATPAAQGAMNALGKEDIPLIFNAVTDPVDAGLVADMDKPGGMVTGVSDYFSIKDQLKGFLEAFPELKTIGVLYSTDEANSKVQIDELKAAGEEFGVDIVDTGVTSVNDVPTAMTSLVNKIDGFFCITDNLAANSATVIGSMLAEKKIPSYAAEQGPVEAGLLMTNGVDYKALGHEAGKLALEVMVDKKSPAEIPVVRTTETKKVVNKDVAEKLGLDESAKVFEGAEIVTTK